MKTVKLTITDLRKSAGMTQQEVADYLNVSFQSVSKWENGVTMPDINQLPNIAELFNVTVDQVLGLKPLPNEEYINRQTHTQEYWSNKLPYLKDTRQEFWNIDYLKMLVCDVWNIDQPIDFLDIGCGFGYFAGLIMPLLPKGSTYTGIDFSHKLIHEGAETFKDSPYPIQFIHGDINHFEFTKQYDFVFCQAILRHVPNPKAILRKMHELTKDDGLLVCVEVNRVLENGGLYIHGLEYEPLKVNNILDPLWQKELEEEGRDYSIGMKIPFYMDELGLRDIQARVNDKVSFYSPNQLEGEHYKESVNSFIRSNGWNNASSIESQEKVSKALRNKGISNKNANKYIEHEEAITHHMALNKNNLSLLKAYYLMITFGRK